MIARKRSPAPQPGVVRIASIAGGCPLMYRPTSDGGHRAMKVFLGLFGQLPKEA